jgi:hypothetical protein
MWLPTKSVPPLSRGVPTISNRSPIARRRQANQNRGSTKDARPRVKRINSHCGGISTTLASRIAATLMLARSEAKAESGTLCDGSMLMREIRVVEWWWMQANGCLRDHALSTEAAAQNEKGRVHFIWRSEHGPLVALFVYR